MPYVSALDPGKKRDPAALAVLEQTQGPDPLCPGGVAWTYTLAGLEQYPLGTPYSTLGEELGVGERVRDRFAGPPLSGSVVGVDATGVGEAVVDLLRSLRPACVLVAVVITGGEGTRRDGLTWHVAKSQLVSNFVRLHHSGRFKVPRGLALKPLWDAQLAAFQEKQRPSGSLTWEAERESDHDDLVLAGMIAAWLGERAPPFRRGDVSTGWRQVSQLPAGVFMDRPYGEKGNRSLPGRW